MRRVATKSGPGLVLGLALGLAIVPGQPATAAGDEASPTVRELMEAMSIDLATLTRELLHSDYPAAANAAQRIADHPMVEPAQRAAIARALGTEMADFKGYDTRVHGAARALAGSARLGDDAAVARHYGELIGGCIGCHSRFRERVQAALGPR